MNQHRFSLLIVAALTFCAVPAMAQQKRISPHETISTVCDNNNRVTLVYGRPYSKDPKTGETRKIWGTLIPYGKIWRTGSDEATLLITQQPITLGGTLVPAGAYTLFTLPTEAGAKLVISKQLGQWGLQYDEKQDFARVDLKKDATDKAYDEFMMGIDKTATGGVIKMMWENTQYSVAFTTKK